MKSFRGRTLTVEQQGSVTARDWAKELGLPTYYEEWEAMARIRSDRLQGRVRFIVCDESETRLAGKPRLRPKQIALPTICALELAHEGFLIGTVYQYSIGIDDLRSVIPSRLGLKAPLDVDGDFIIAEASFVDSALAEKAQEGVRRKILSHCCPVLWAPDGAPTGTGLLVQTSLVPGDYPGCPNARVLGWSG
ncbi:MAG: hypothetical protein H8K07_16460 [Nitrospira sp.]|nr:hypothetical protein [Nitrospira sp.]